MDAGLTTNSLKENRDEVTAQTKSAQAEKIHNRHEQGDDTDKVWNKFQSKRQTKARVHALRLGFPYHSAISEVLFKEARPREKRG